MKTEELYKIAINTRNLEISLFWQRSNYFLVLNTAIAIGLFAIEKPEYQAALAVIGIFVSFLWFKVNLGSKYWQSRWEHRAKLLENQINKEIGMFSASSETIYSEVYNQITDHKKNNNISLYDWGVLSKPSVSKMMAILSVGFIMLWSFILAFSFSAWQWP